MIAARTFADFGIHVPSVSGGEEVRAICPECTPTRKPQNQHERDLCVNVDKGVWNCQHCGWAGGLSDYAAMPRREEKKYRRPEPKIADHLPPGLIDWFEKRGISAETLSGAGVGYEGTGKGGWIAFPYFKGGEILNVKYRTADKRMRQEKNPEPCFYNHDGALKAGGSTLTICEGEGDCLSFIECGVPAVVSVPNGAPAQNAKNLKSAFTFLELESDFLARWEHIVLAVDADEPGKRLEHELSIRLGQERCSRVHYPAGCKDANDVLQKFGPQAVRDLVSRAKPFPIDGLYQAEDVREKIYELYDRGLRGGDSTGWASVDQFYTVRPCEMTIVTGIPGSGKSTWLDALAVNLHFVAEWKFAYCSPENWPIERHIAGIAEKLMGRPFAAGNGKLARMSRDELDSAIEHMNGSFFFTQLQEDQMSIAGILSVMQSAIKRHRVNGIILDPWNELEYHRPSDKTETEFVSEALGKVRRFARLNNVHVWIVAHPTKLKKDDSGKYPVPRLYDINGSAHFYNKADMGVTIHRPVIGDTRTQVHVSKVRFRECGKVGMAELNYRWETGTYEDIG